MDEEMLRVRSILDAQQFYIAAAVGGKALGNANMRRGRRDPSGLRRPFRCR
jgi:hypothetical protein